MFFVGIKKDVKLSHSLIFEAFQVKNENLLHPFAVRAAKLLASKCSPTSLEAYKSQHDTVSTNIKNIFLTSKKVYEGFLAINSDDCIEQCLCDLRMNFENDNIILYKE